MADIARAARQLRSFFWRVSVEEEVDDELDFHVAMRTREYIDAGLEPDAARAAALRRFGDMHEVNAACRRLGNERERDMRRTEYLADLRQDFAYAIRQLGRTPAFTSIAVLTLALGIGATATIFSVVNAVVLRPLPFAAPERVMVLMDRFKEGDANVSAGNFADWRAENRVFARLAASQKSSFNLADVANPERVVGARVTHEFFSVFGVQPTLGRVFLAEEDRPGREGEVVLSHKLWSRRFGSDRDVVGRDIRLNGSPYRVVGVMSARFDYTERNEELWVPIAFTPERLAMHDEHYLEVAGLLEPGVSRERAQAEMSAIAKRMEQRFPKDNKGIGVTVASFTEELIGDVRPRLYILLGAVGCVLAIACSNVANLLLARGTARAKELAIRTALGAGRSRVVRQLLTESVVLAMAGALVGLVLAFWMTRVLVAAAPPGVPRLEATRIDAAVLAFTTIVSIGAGMLFGLAPALRLTRANLHGALQEGGRTSAGSTRDRARTTLVAVEVALALTLLVGAGLLIRSGIHLQRVEPGFDPEGVLTARLTLPATQYADPSLAARTFERVVESVRAAPGVQSAAVTSAAPWSSTGGGNSNGLVPEGRPQDLSNAITSRLRIITPEYFETLRIPLRRGRLFDARDIAGAPRAMIISERLARVAWPGVDPIGKRISCCEGTPTDPRWKTIIGVVGDVRSRGPMVDIEPEFYLPIEQVPPEAWDWIQRSMTIVARGENNPASLTPAVRAAVRGVDPSVPLYGVSTMRDGLARATAGTRFNTTLLTSLGAIGLVLAAVGIYSVIAYFVSQRTHEIGVRMALGADAWSVVMLMTRQGMRPVSIGIGAGLVMALGAARVLRGSLYGVTATDPVTYAGVALLLAGVALLAIYVPARRATRVQPTEALSGP